MWHYRGEERPHFAEDPGPGQESVWDYPRPPRLERDNRLVEVKADGRSIARTRSAIRVLETASPPTFYIPDADVDFSQLTPLEGRSQCEWKGSARYMALRDAPDIAVAWHYPNPAEAFKVLRDYKAFYPGRVACYVDGERVRPQPGGFYGGWMTNEIVGPVKGEPGTAHW